MRIVDKVGEFENTISLSNNENMETLIDYFPSVNVIMITITHYFDDIDYSQEEINGLVKLFENTKWEIFKAE